MWEIQAIPSLRTTWRRGGSLAPKAGLSKIPNEQEGFGCTHSNGLPLL